MNKNNQLLLAIANEKYKRLGKESRKTLSLKTNLLIGLFIIIYAGFWWWKLIETN